MFSKTTVLIAFVTVMVLYFVAKYVTEWYMRVKEDDLNASQQSSHTVKKKPASEDCAEGGCGMRSICNGKEDVSYEYYEDEELDYYKGRAADSYTDYEVSEFRDVLETLRKDEVAPWLNSLCARGVALPAQLRTEAIDLAKSNNV